MSLTKTHHTPSPHSPNRRSESLSDSPLSLHYTSSPNQISGSPSPILLHTPSSPKQSPKKLDGRSSYNADVLRHERRWDKREKQEREHQKAKDDAKWRLELQTGPVTRSRRKSLEKIFTECGHEYDLGQLRTPRRERKEISHSLDSSRRRVGGTPFRMYPGYRGAEDVCAGLERICLGEPAISAQVPQRFEHVEVRTGPFVNFFVREEEAGRVERLRKERARKKKLKAAGWKTRKRGEMEKGEEDAGEESVKTVADEEKEEKSVVEERKPSGKLKFFLGRKLEDLKCRGYT